jgi:hypothetical protein
MHVLPFSCGVARFIFSARFSQNLKIARHCEMVKNVRNTLTQKRFYLKTNALIKIDYYTQPNLNLYTPKTELQFCILHSCFCSSKIFALSVDVSVEFFFSRWTKITRPYCDVLPTCWRKLYIFLGKYDEEKFRNLSELFPRIFSRKNSLSSLFSNILIWASESNSIAKRRLRLKLKCQNMKHLRTAHAHALLSRYNRNRYRVAKIL